LIRRTKIVATLAQWRGPENNAQFVDDRWWEHVPKLGKSHKPVETNPFGKTIDDNSDERGRDCLAFTTRDRER
jgi:hypothetical protein